MISSSHYIISTYYYLTGNTQSSQFVNFGFLKVSLLWMQWCLCCSIVLGGPMGPSVYICIAFSVLVSVSAFMGYQVVYAL